MPIVAASAAAEKNAARSPRPSMTLLPAVIRPTRPSVAPSDVASQAPIAISQIARPVAPKKTLAMIERLVVSLGR